MFDDLQGIALVWTGSLGLAGFLLIKLAWRTGQPVNQNTGRPQPSLRRLLLDDDGLAYTLAYVFTLPLYMLLVVVIIETSFIMIAKMGTVYAAFAAARTAVVRYPAESPDEAHRLTQLAAVRAFVPFANGAGKGAVAPAAVEQYFTSRRPLLNPPITDNYLRNKCRDANANILPVIVNLEEPDGQYRANLTVELTYNFSFVLPGAARLLGGKKEGTAGQYVLPIKSRVTLMRERPRNENGQLGISYASP